MDELNQDRLYQLLPTIYRIRDAEQGEPLKALLRVISEQVNLLEADIAQLYENWFIETCEDWVVPYIGDLIGYRAVHEAGEPVDVNDPQALLRNKILIPRREVANTIRYRRRKGTLALLELLANDVAGWPARAVEYYALLCATQSVKHFNPERGKTVDIRNTNQLELLASPFDNLAHTPDIRRINSTRTQGRYNLPSVGVFVWRLRSYSVTQTPAYCYEAEGPHCYTFSVLGNNSPLYLKPKVEALPTQIAQEINLPVAIRANFLAQQLTQIYAPSKSIYIWVGMKSGNKIRRQPIPLKQIIAADLSDWQYIPPKGKVALDPVLGRIAFPARQWPKNGVWVNYHYGFSGALGGGEYSREIKQPQQMTLYRVGEHENFTDINSALIQWQQDAAVHAVIEITDSGVYVEPINIDIKANQRSLQLRAANRKRPIIRLLDWQTDRPDSMTINGAPNTRFTLDGLLVTGRGLHITGQLAELTIKHSTLVPGWTLSNDCKPHRSTEPSLEIYAAHVCVKIEYSILGAIQVDPIIAVEDDNDDLNDADSIDDLESDDESENYDDSENYNESDDDNKIPEKHHSRDEFEQHDTAEHKPQRAQQMMSSHCVNGDSEARLNPIRICISDSILDATHHDIEVIGMPGCPVAHVILTILRTTVIGHIQVHAIELAENSIFYGRVTVARRQQGCVRFCYVTPASRTPRRFNCQPDLVERMAEQQLQKTAEAKGLLAPDEQILATTKRIERLRVRPQFNSIRYAQPTYCQLSDCCATEIKSGADDGSEMGAFHHLYQPHRVDNLNTRLDEFLPAAMDVGIIFSS